MQDNLEAQGLNSSKSDTLVQSGATDKTLLFVSGVPRSGTSALVSTLNLHPDFLIGMERFFFLIRKEELKPEHFKKSRFLDIHKGDTHSSDEKSWGAAKAYERAKFIGDKYPLLFQSFGYMLETFPDAHHVYIVRNPISVMESYEARFENKDDRWEKSWKQGLEEWNASLGTVASLTEDQIQHFSFVIYEDFFDRADAINRLFVSLGSSGLPEEQLNKILMRFRELNSKKVLRRDDIRRYAAEHADWNSYKKVLNLASCR